MFGFGQRGCRSFVVNEGDRLKNDDYHMHKCECGHIWQHSYKCQGSKKAHTCPKCGEQCWWQYDPEHPERKPSLLQRLLLRMGQ